MSTVIYPHLFIADLSGRPLDSGSVYIGSANQDPETHPISCFWDADLTIPASQPLTVTAGYIVHAGARAVPHVAASSYSIRVRDRSGVEVDYDAARSGPVLASDLAADGGAAMVGTTSGDTLQEVLDDLSPGSDGFDYWVGREYLSTFRTTLTDGNGSNIVLSGDSTTAGTALAAGFVPDVLLKSLGADYGADYLVITNRGQSGKDTQDWLNTYLAGDMAVVANLYVFRWGVNDPDSAVHNLTVEQSLANYEQALTTFRASKTINDASVLIMGPNAAIGRGRTAAWFSAMTEGLRNLARTHKCAFFDTFNFARDALENISQGWDNAFGDGTAAIHPLDPLDGMIYAEVARVLFDGLGPYKSNHFWNRRGATGLQLAAADLPSTFETGIFIDIALLANGFPADGFVVTIKSNANDVNALQLFWDNNGVQTRIGGAFWLDWKPLTKVANVTASTGFTLPGSEKMRTSRSGDNVQGMGYVTMDTPGTLTSGQSIATVASGFRPEGNVYNATLVVFQSSDSTTEEVPALIYSSSDGSKPGRIETQAVSAKTANRIYLKEGWIAA